MTRLRAAIAPACALAAACAGHAPQAPASGPPPIVFDLAATVPAYQERYVCQLVQMPAAPGEIFVSGGSYHASAGLHHFLLFRTSLPGVDHAARAARADVPSPPPNVGQPIDCFEGGGVMQYERGFVSGGAKRVDYAHFPGGLGLPFHGGDVLLLQAHVLNSGGADLSASIHVELDTIDAADVDYRVGTFRFYDPYIVVAPHASATARMRCPIHHDVTLISAGSHMHKRGVGYRAFVDAPGAPSTAPFYSTSDWQSPPFWYGPLDVKAGGAIRFECDYQNADDATYVQGLSAETNEMCMFSAFYAPAQDGDEEDCAGMDSLGTGTRSCAQTTSCLELCSPSDEPHFETGDPTVGACWQKCIVDSCPNAAAALLPQLECARDQCATECATFGATCSQCVSRRCKAQLDACQSLACSGP